MKIYTVSGVDDKFATKEQIDSLDIPNDEDIENVISKSLENPSSSISTKLATKFAAVEAARVEAVEAAAAATALVGSLGSTVVSATDNGDGTFTIWGPVTPTDPGTPTPSGLYTDTYSNTY